MSGQETVTDENFRTGAVVSRGPDWRWGNQDAHPPGRLLRKTNDGRCWVRWGNGSEFDYRIGSSDAHDLVYGRTPLTLPPVDAPLTTEQMATLKALEGTDVTADTFLRGAIVSRGRDWRWADQDKDGPGRLLRLCKDGVRCWVAWGDPSAHKERDYRIGSNDCFDLVFGAVPAEPRKRVPEDPVPADGTPVTTENYVRFATVSRGPGWRWGDQDKSGPGTMMRTNKNKTHCWVQWPDGTERDYRIELGDLVYGTTPAAPLDLNALAAAAKFPVGEPVTADNVVIGGRVSRGRDWKWGDQDGGKPGYIIARTGDGLRCWVRWDVGNEAGKKDMDYRIGSSDAHDLVYGETPSGDHDLAAAANDQMAQITALKGRDVTRANFIRGAIVSRGRDWKWGKQDAAGNGRLARMCSDGDRCWVRWGDDTERDYRIGSADAFDLVYGSTPARPDVELSDDVEDEEAAEERETSSDDETNSSAEVDEGKTCPVCVDPLSRGRYKKIRCDNGHIACHACLDACIIQNFANARRSNAEAPVLRCFADDKCDCVLELVDIARVASREATETYLRVCQDYRDAQALADAYGALQSELRRLRAALRSGATDQLWRGQREDNTANGAAATGAGGMTTMLSNDFVLDAAVVAEAPVDGTVTQAQRVTGPGVALEGRFLKLMFPASLMCPRCQLGPIDISGCDNLESHHLERIGPAGGDEGDDGAAGGDQKAEEADEHEHESGDDAGDATEKSPKRLSSRRVRIIRNECPGCKFFGATVSDWKVWDGVIRRMPTAAARSTAASATASL